MEWSKEQLIEKGCVIVPLRDASRCDEWVLRSEAEKRIEELESRNLALSSAYTNQRDAKEQLVEDHAELQRKYKALIQKLHDKMNEIDNRRGAGSQLLELDELRALLENDDEH